VAFLKDGEKASQGMGIAVDISRGGLLLETLYPIEGHGISLMFVDSEDKLVESKGRILHCQQTDSGKFSTGISLIGSEKEKDRFASRLVKAYNLRKRIESFSKLECCDWDLHKKVVWISEKRQ